MQDAFEDRIVAGEPCHGAGARRAAGLDITLSVCAPIRRRAPSVAGSVGLVPVHSLAQSQLGEGVGTCSCFVVTMVGFDDEFAAVDSSLLSTSPASAGKSQDERPNVLVLMSDQHSKFHLGCTGDPLVRTPNLDRLRQDGLLFSNAYTPAPVCVPARMSFMTTCSPSTNKVWGNQDTLSSAIPTWAHSLGAAGYETALIGRMHFVGQGEPR